MMGRVAIALVGVTLVPVRARGQTACSLDAWGRAGTLGELVIDEPCTFDGTALTLGPAVSVRFAGGVIEVPAAARLEIDGPIAVDGDVPGVQLFSIGTGGVVDLHASPTSTVYPEWWSGVTADATRQTAGILDAVQAVVDPSTAPTRLGKTVKLSGRTYHLTAPIVLPPAVALAGISTGTSAAGRTWPTVLAPTAAFAVPACGVGACPPASVVELGGGTMFATLDAFAVDLSRVPARAGQSTIGIHVQPCAYHDAITNVRVSGRLQKDGTPDPTTVGIQLEEGVLVSSVASSSFQNLGLGVFLFGKGTRACAATIDSINRVANNEFGGSVVDLSLRGASDTLVESNHFGAVTDVHGTRVTISGESTTTFLRNRYDPVGGALGGQNAVTLTGFADRTLAPVVVVGDDAPSSAYSVDVGSLQYHALPTGFPTF
jgi:hypothetical protein